MCAKCHIQYRSAYRHLALRMMPLATVYTPRLVIRPLKAADAVEVYNLGQQSHVASAMRSRV